MSVMAFVHFKVCVITQELRSCRRGVVVCSSWAVVRSGVCFSRAGVMEHRVQEGVGQLHVRLAGRLKRQESGIKLVQRWADLRLYLCLCLGDSNV
jgi:hypothetical protein